MEKEDPKVQRRKRVQADMTKKVREAWSRHETLLSTKSQEKKKTAHVPEVSGPPKVMTTMKGRRKKRKIKKKGRMMK